MTSRSGCEYTTVLLQVGHPAITVTGGASCCYCCRWGILLGYNFFVILAKSCLQLVGCVYLSDVSERICWIVQLLSILCLRAGNYKQGQWLSLRLPPFFH